MGFKPDRFGAYVVDSLRERNTNLNQQADEQEKASAVNGSASTAGAGSAAKAANGSSGSDPYNGKPREGEEGRDADYARLAQAAYEEGDPILMVGARLMLTS